MSYQVLARKWRPQTFADVVGQEHVLTALANGLSLGRIHHAYLFSGTRGVGFADETGAGIRIDAAFGRSFRPEKLKIEFCHCPVLSFCAFVHRSSACAPRISPTTSIIASSSLCRNA